MLNYLFIYNLFDYLNACVLAATSCNVVMFRLSGNNFGVHKSQLMETVRSSV